MGYRVKPFTMSVRNNSTQEFVDVGLLGSDVDADIQELQENVDSLEQKTDWFVTPEMFGAEGDGTTDDSTAIQAALDSAKTVVFSRGAVYEIKDTMLTISNSNTIIYGNGCVIQKHTETANTQAEMLRINGVNNIKIYDLILDGDYVVTGSNRNEHNHGITIHNAQNILIDGCIFKNIEGDAVYFGGLGQVNGAQVSHCVFGKTGRWSVTVIDAKSISISDNIFIESDTCCIDIEPNNANQKTEVSITNNTSFGCAKLVNLAYGYTVTDISVIVDGWESHNDSVSNANTTLYPDIIETGLFGIRLPGGAVPTGIWNITNVNFNGCTGILFYERMASKLFVVNLSDINVTGCSGDVAFYSRTEHNSVTFARQLSLSWDASNSYTNFASLAHGDSVTTGGGIIYSVYADGSIPSSLLGNASDFVLDTDHWTFFSSQQGTGANALPLKWEELLIECLFGLNTSVAITFHIIKQMESRTFTAGSAKTNDNHQVFLAYNASSNTVTLTNWWFRDVDRASDSYVRIFYR